MKKIMLNLFLLIFLASPAWAMRTPMFGFATPSTSATNYIGFRGSADATENKVRMLAPVNGLIEELYVFAGTAPGGSASYTLTLVKNGSATAMTCAIAAAATSCSDTNHKISIAAGDTFSISSVPASTPASSSLHISAVFNSFSGGPAIIVLASSPSDNPSNSATDFSAIQGKTTFGITASSNVMPTSGTFGNFFVKAVAAPGAGASGKQYVFTVHKNSVATTITCTVFETATTCSDTSNTFSVVAGDLVRISSAPTSTPTATIYAFGMSFLPTVGGESPIMYFYGGGAHSTTVDNYSILNGAASAYSATETATDEIAVPNMFAKNLYATGTAPGASKSVTHALRINAATSGLTCTRTGTSATSCQDTTHVVSMASFDLVDMLWSPSGTPTVGSTNRVSMTIFMDPRDKFYGGALYGSTIY